MKLTATTRKKVKVVARPTKWSEVRLKCVPLQPDEEGFGNEVTTSMCDHLNRFQEDLVVDDISPIVPDPLGLSSVDLRSLQAAHITSTFGHLSLDSLQAPSQNQRKSHSSHRPRGLGVKKDIEPVLSQLFKE